MRKRGEGKEFAHPKPRSWISRSKPGSRFLAVLRRSVFLSLTYSNLRLIEWRMEWDELGMNWVLIRSRYMGIIGQKQSKNRRKTKSHAKTAQSARTTRRTAVCPRRTIVCSFTTGRAPHHGQPVVATVPAGLATPRTLRFDLFWNPV